jgi:2-aminobenzoate-CoA ligase
VLTNSTTPSDLLIKQLQEHVKASIAPYKYPRDIQFRKALPKTATGKIQRFQLKSS